MSGKAMQYKEANPPYEKPVVNAKYTSDPSLDSIFFAIWTGAISYAVAREGLELSRLASASVALASSTAVYMQWYQLAAKNLFNLTPATKVLA